MHWKEVLVLPLFVIFVVDAQPIPDNIAQKKERASMEKHIDVAFEVSAPFVCNGKQLVYTSDYIFDGLDVRVGLSVLKDWTIRTTNTYGPYSIFNFTGKFSGKYFPEENRWQSMAIFKPWDIKPNLLIANPFCSKWESLKSADSVCCAQRRIIMPMQETEIGYIQGNWKYKMAFRKFDAIELCPATEAECMPEK